MSTPSGQPPEQPAQPDNSEPTVASSAGSPPEPPATSVDPNAQAPEAATATPAPPPAAPAAGVQPPPPGYGYAPNGSLVPVYPDGKPMYDAMGQIVSPRSRAIAAILAWFLGVIGIHRFYVGKVGTGILMIFTLGGLGIWVLIDFILILVGSFRDKEERPLINW